MLRIGINGFGRIGRAIFRNNQESRAFDIVAINELNPDLDNIAYTANYDTLYGRNARVVTRDGNMLVDGDSLRALVSHESSIDSVDWDAAGVDYVIDATGVAANVVAAREIVKSTRVKRVFVTHSPDGVDFSMVLGSNESELNLDEHQVISTSICDATAMAPVINLINKEFGLARGFVTTLHPWLNYQNLMDGQSSSWSVPGEIYHHYALGRSALGNMIPKPTSAIDATCKVVSGVSSDMLGSFSYRTPTAIVGSADLTLEVERFADRQQIMDLFGAFEQSQDWKIIHNNLEPLVSLDFLKSNYSAIVDHRWTDVIDGRLVKLVLWYDNEWGYSARVVDQVKFVSKKDRSIDA